MIAAPMLVYTAATPFPGPAALPVVLGTLLLIACGIDAGATPEGVHAVLARRPLVATGRISYSLYLWHWPLLSGVRFVTADGPGDRAAALAAAVVLAAAQWKWVEQPWRSEKTTPLRWVARRPLSASMIALCGVLLLSLTLRQSERPGLAARRSPAGMLEDVSERGEAYRMPAGRSAAAARLGAPRGSDEAARFVLWGDSHAMILATEIDRLARDRGISGDAYLCGGMVPVDTLWQQGRGDQSRAAAAAVRAAVKSGDVRDLVLCGRWSLYCNGPDLGRGSRLRMATAAGPADDDDIIQALHAGFSHVASLCEANDVRLWVVEEVPPSADAEPAMRRLRQTLYPGAAIPDGPPGTQTDYRRSQARVRQALAGIDGVRTIRTAAACFDADGTTRQLIEGRSCYRDDNHLSAWGVRRLLGPELARTFDQFDRPSSPDQTASRAVDQSPR